MKNSFLQRMNKWGISDLGGVRKMSGECRGNVGRGLAWNFFTRVEGRSGEMKSNHAIITRLSRNNHLMLLRGIRYAAMLLTVLMVGTGQMWATNQTYNLANPSASTYGYSSGPIRIYGNVADAKINSSSNVKCFQMTAGYPLIITSNCANIKSISFDACSSSSGSSGTSSDISIYYHNGAHLTLLSSNFTATLDGNSLASLDNIPLTKIQSSKTTISVNFTTNQYMIAIVRKAQSPKAINISVTYDDAITPPDELVTVTATSPDANAFSLSPSSTGSMSGSTTGSSKSATYNTKYYTQISSTNTYTMPTGETLSAGDWVLFDIAPSAATKGLGVLVQNGEGWDSVYYTTTYATKGQGIGYIFPYKIQTSSSTLVFKRNNSENYIHGFTIYHAAAPTTKRIYMEAANGWNNSTPYFYVKSWGVTGSEVLMTQVSDCETDVFYADIPSGDNNVLFTRQSTNSGIKYKDETGNYNQSVDINCSSNDKFTFNGDWNKNSTGKSDFNYGTYSTPTYTISFNNGGGIGTMTAISSLACGANQAITANSFEKAGYSFANWTANVDVTVGGETVSAGSAIANQATIQNISSNITLTAAWTQEVPTSVSVGGQWAYFPGQTISLTAETTGGTGSYTYQWQKYVTSDWVDIDGEESATYTKATCATSDCGKYRCVVSKAGGSTISNEFEVHVFTMEGDYSGGSSWTTYNPVHSGKSDTVGTVTLSLTASSLYEFGIKDNYNNGWYRNTGFIIDNWTKEGFGKGEGNCRLFTGPAGTYTFTLDLYHAGDGTPYVQVSLEYPEVSHPAAGYTYFEKPSEWTNVYLYWYTSDGDRLTSWENSPELKNTTEICGTTYYYSPLWDKYSYVIYKGNGSNQWPGSGYTTSGCSGKYMDRTDYSSPAWASFETYTITFAANGGSGTMSAINGICPNANQALTANAYTKTGHTFANWTANVDVKVGGETVSAGSSIANQATIQNISGNITLTAQWNPITYDITYMDGESEFAGTHADGHPTTHTYGTATALKGATKAGYTLEGWYTEAGLENKVTSLGATAFTANITLYAKWTANEYSITYMDGESAFAGTHEDGYPTTHTYGTATALKSATKTGYTLEGWYTEAGLENKVTSLGATAYTANITLYAKWTANSYTLTLDDNGGSADGSGTIQTLGTSFTPSAPTYSGYTVEGYYTSANCTTKVATAAGALQASITVSEVAWTNSSSQWTKNGDATFYAKWKANTPTITCSKNKVTISGPAGATIYYTTDGSTTPTSSSTEYTGAFDIDETITVKAIAITSGDEFVDSDVASEECEAATLVTASWPMIANDTVTLNGSATTSVLTTSRVVKAGMGDITTALSVSYTDYAEKMAQVPTIGTVGTKGAVTDTSYVKYTITVAYGYTFTPTGFSAIVGRIGTDNGYAQAVLKTGSTTIKSSTASNPSRSGKSAEKTVYSASFDDASTYSAGTTIDLYIYFGGAMASGKSYVVSEVSITGEYAEVQIVPSFTSPASDPDDVEYTVGDLIEQLEVVATGSPTPTLQWYKNTANSTSSPTPVAITDSTNATFTPSNASASDLYYFCRATNSAGSADSRIFHVTVNAAPTYDATYDENGHGTAPDDEEEVTDVTLPQIDAVSGWRHTAWTADQDVKIGGVTIDAGEELEIGAQAYLTDNTTFTAVWTATYAVAEGTHSNGSISISPTVGIAGETIEIEATANDDYLFDEWQIVKTSDATDVTTTLLGDNKSKASTSFTLPAYGVTINATFVAIDYCATMAINTSSTGALAVDNAVPTTGTATAKVVGVGDASSLYVDGYGLSFTKTGDKIEVTLPNVMVEGSIICIELYNGAANAGRGLTIQATDNTDVADIVYDFLEGGAKKLYYTVKSTDTKLIGKNQFRVTRYSNVRLKSLRVGECGGKYIEPVLTYDNTTLYTDGTPSSASATLTGNTGSGAVTYSVSPTGVVSINESTGVITAVAAGSATVTASVAAANGYIAATATCGITVKGCGYEQIAKATLSSKTAASDATGGTVLISGLSEDNAPYKLNGKPSWFGIKLSSDFEVGDSVIFKLKVGDWWSGASASELPVVVFAGKSLDKEIYRTENLTKGTNNVFVRFTITQDMIDDGLKDSVMIWRSTTNDASCTECCTQNHQMYSVQIKRATCSSGMIKPVPGVSDANWGDASSWIGGVAPTINDHVVITNNMTVNVTTAQAKEIELTDGATLTISAGKALVVANSITKNGAVTSVEDLQIGSTLAAGTGALVMGNHNGTNQATVQFATKAYKNGNFYVNQYIGTPFNDETDILQNYYNSWIYAITYQDGVPGWNDRVNKGEGLNPFEGYDLMRPETTQNVVLSMEGTLVSSSDVTLTSSSSPVKLTYNGSSNTENVLANSWMAPIKITAFEESDFTNMEATIYIFNAGSTDDVGKEGPAGNYSTYPIDKADATDVIPSMQSFSVYATAASPSLKLDYSKLVYDPAVAGLAVQPNFAPRRAKAEAMTSLKLHVVGESGFADELKVYVHEDFDEGFENGWDAHKMYGLDEAPQLYAVTQDGEMAVNCVPDAESMLIGLKAGTMDQQYTMTFEYDDAEPLYMVDTKTNTYTQVMTGNEYTFQTNDLGAHSRFILTHYAPQMPTDLEPTSDSSLKGREKGIKFIEGEKMFILMNGVLYDATGRRVEGVRE